MAFSAHNEMGQNERVDTVCCTAPTYQTVNSESKVCIRLPPDKLFNTKALWQYTMVTPSLFLLFKS